jgi:uncharacterized protein YukE
MPTTEDGYGYLHVSYPHLGIAAQDLRSAHNALIGALETMEDRLRTMVWISAAASYFEYHKQQWDLKVDDMATTLNTFALTLGNIEDHYRATEHKNSLIWGAGA